MTLLVTLRRASLVSSTIALVFLGAGTSVQAQTPTQNPKYLRSRPPFTGVHRGTGPKSAPGHSCKWRVATKYQKCLVYGNFSESSCELLPAGTNPAEDNSDEMFFDNAFMVVLPRLILGCRRGLKPWPIGLDTSRRALEHLLLYCCELMYMQGRRKRTPLPPPQDFLYYSGKKKSIHHHRGNPSFYLF